jgi:hypothetical protein
MAVFHMKDSHFIVLFYDCFYCIKASSASRSKI